MTRAGAYLAAMDALKAGLQFDRAADLSDEATRRLTNVDAADRAALLVRAADYRGQRETAAVGLELIEQALEIYCDSAAERGLRPGARQAANLLLHQLGRFDDAYRVAKSAVEAAEHLGVPQLHRRMLAMPGLARGRGRRRGSRPPHGRRGARTRWPPVPIHSGDIWIGVIRTDILLRSGGSAEDVEAAGEPGLAVAASIGDRQLAGRPGAVQHLRSTDPCRLRRPGCGPDRPRDRGALRHRPMAHPPRTRQPGRPSRTPRCRPRPPLSAPRRQRVDPVSSRDRDAKDLVNYAALVDLWDGAPERALSLVKPFLDDCPSAPRRPHLLGPTFVLAARAAADIVEHDPQPGRVRGDYLRDLMELHARAPVDPFTSDQPRRRPGSWGVLASRDRAPRGSALAGAVGHGRRRVGQAQPAARRGVLQVARRAGRAGDRPRHHRSAAAAPRQPRGPRARSPLDSHRRDHRAGARGHPIPAERRSGAAVESGVHYCRCRPASLVVDTPHLVAPPAPTASVMPASTGAGSRWLPIGCSRSR